MGRSSSELPDKLFFKIGEVADIVGVKPHVLRYWETEFPALKPQKTRGSHRMYRRKDVELAVQIRRLVHEEGYTIPGARRRLRQLGRHKRDSPTHPSVSRETAYRSELLALREQLTGLLRELDALHEEGGEEPASEAKVEQVVQAPSTQRRR